MASMTFRSGAIQPPISLRRFSGDLKTPTQISPARKSPKIRSILKSPLTNQRSSNNSSIFPQNLDDWVHESAAEIVRNLRKAPLLVHVHEDSIETEAAVQEDWDDVAMRWRDGGAPAGVMLVGEIEGETGEEREDEGETRVWGIVVQGKGSGPGLGRVGCYLLKTSRVGSGLGFGCTHFCLTRVRDFRESALSQINSCWLRN